MVRIKIKFWGVRGSIPTPGVKYVKYGGNTACVEMRFPNDCLFIFDAGTGIRELGNILSKKQLKVHIFLSHFHGDHVHGLPFFTPLYKKGSEITIHGMDIPEKGLDKIISNQMESIYFPVNLQSLSAHITFHALSEGSHNVEGIRVDTVYVNHPGLAMGFVVNVGKTKICYFTDNELVPDWAEKSFQLNYRPDTREKILKLISGADLLIHDAQYTDDEYKTRVGWGHTSLNEVLKLAKDGKVHRLALFHHDPDHFDDRIDVIEADCMDHINGGGHVIQCFAAHEGLELHF